MRRGSLLAAALLLLGTTGCLLPAIDRKRTGRPIEAADASRIVEKGATKLELFESLGAPMAIVGPGEVVHVPAATVHHVDEIRHDARWFGGGSWAQQGDAWLELFAARRPLRDTHRVYYWYATAEHGFSMFLLFAFSTRHDSSRELWVLVDEGTGRAEDAVYRRR